MDARDRWAMTRPILTDIDTDKMVAYVDIDDEPVPVPIVFEVCPLCDGRGKHVNPSIDAHGLSAEDFYDDPDFERDYFSGVYDITCNRCHGDRVVPEMDNKRVKPEIAERIYEIEEADRDFRMMQESERRFGA